MSRVSIGSSASRNEQQQGSEIRSWFLYINNNSQLFFDGDKFVSHPLYAVVSCAARFHIPGTRIFKFDYCNDAFKRRLFTFDVQLGSKESMLSIRL